jgi:Rieske Fe-S protein
VISRWIVGIGAVIAIVFALLWVRDLARGRNLDHAGSVEPEKRLPRSSEAEPRAPGEVEPENRFPRSVFLETSTLAVGGAIGALVTLPVLGFALGPSLLKQGVPDVDLGPLSDFPENQFVITTFTSNPEQGNVSRRTAYVRNNGFLGKVPSLTILSNHCAHLGCPVQPNGQPDFKMSAHYKTVTTTPVTPSGFGCPCHGGQYDTEGNRIAGPPVRALDRYTFSIINGHLYVGEPFSVAYVEGKGADAQIHRVNYSFPGEHVDGWESWLYPIQPPHG